MYSSCMKAAGYGVRYPQDAVELARSIFRTRAVTDAPTGPEIQQAVADARCQQGSRIAARYEAAFVRLASSWISANRNGLRNLATLQRDAIRRAEEILGTPSDRRDPSRGGGRPGV